MDRWGRNPCVTGHRPAYRILLEQINLMNCRLGYRMRQSEVIMLWILWVVFNDYNIARDALSQALVNRTGDGSEFIVNIRMLLCTCFNRIVTACSSFLTHADIQEYLAPVITHENGQQQISIIVDTSNSVNIFVMVTQPGQTLMLSLPDLSITTFTTHQQALASILSQLNPRARTRYQVMKLIRKGRSMN